MESITHVPLSLLLEKALYFTPRFDTDNLPIRYVALYEKEKGIGWYGEVVSWRRAPRSTLPGQRGKGAEDCHVFDVLEWKELEHPICVAEYGPNPIAYTNYFLLTNSEAYSELLLRSEAEYRFYTELRRRTEEAAIKGADGDTAFEYGEAKVLFRGTDICVYRGGRHVDICTLKEFSAHPNRTFRRLQEYVEGE